MGSTAARVSLRVRAPSTSMRHFDAAALHPLVHHSCTSREVKHDDFKEFAQLYAGFSVEDRVNALKLLSGPSFSSDSRTIEAAAAGIGQEGGRARLRGALKAPYERFLSRMTCVPGGLKFVVDLRADLEAFTRHKSCGPELEDMRYCLRDLLAESFAEGELELARITWDSPASLLEKIGHYEAVHPTRRWPEVKQRVGNGRRIYALFHPKMPAEPVAFVNVALVRGLASSVQDIMAESPCADAEQRADAAMFYSISSTQKGLKGVDLGNFLIKRAVGDMVQELPGVQLFSTLSPIPGFRRWLLDSSGKDDTSHMMTTQETAAVLRRAADVHSTMNMAAGGRASTTSVHGALSMLMKDPSFHVVHEDVLRGPLLRLCQHYLLSAKRPGSPLAAMDPVANFHLRNGACLERLNWRGDVSRRGRAQSATIMANYLYPAHSPAVLGHNARQYEETGRIGTGTFIAV